MRSYTGKKGDGTNHHEGHHSALELNNKFPFFGHKRSLKPDQDTASVCPGDRAAEFVHLFMILWHSRLKNKQTSSLETKANSPQPSNTHFPVKL